MVKVKEASALSFSENWSADEWLKHLQEKGYSENLHLVQYGLELAQLSGQEFAVETGETCLKHGIAMAEVLTDLGMDVSSIVAGIIYSSVQYAELSLDIIEEQFGFDVARLVKGVSRMNTLSATPVEKMAQKKSQLDNWRKMLLAMVDDVRVVLIKLADRLCILRSMAHMPEPMRQQYAYEAMNIYAPLAHRLGIGAMKWEMEDLSFRYLYPEEYKTIAKGLRSKRLERDRYVNWIVEQLQTQIKQMGFFHYSIYGRSKHIHSIYNKMLRKKVPLDEIYDATAVRILVDTPDQCYDMLGLVHSLWTPIPKEFDDYITHPKPNGYQSLHTAVIGPEERIFEVQIRTFDMHNRAEMGVAAHWKYKEGEQDEEMSHERKIAWLREVLSWHQEMAGQSGEKNHIEAPVLEDRVYVFTPEFDVIDLSRGSSVLDFAYHLHTNIGHRCRGAKINGSIVPLTQVMKTGDRVEILTAKEERPSRDWLNPQLGYLHTSRAKAKVFHWFKKQDFDLHCQQGQSVLERELKIMHLKSDVLLPILNDFNCHDVDDLYAALGRGDVKLASIIARITPQSPPAPRTLHRPPVQKQNDLSKQLVIEGVGHLLTHFAKCCHPVPGDDVVGYMTIGRGVSIHRQDCVNITQAPEEQRQRFLKATWGNEFLNQPQRNIVKIQVEAYDSPTLLKELTQLITEAQIRLVALQTRIVGSHKPINHLQLTLEVSSLEHFIQLQKDIVKLPGLMQMKQQPFRT